MGPAMLPAEGMVLKPIDTSSFDLEVGEGHFMGGNTAMCELAQFLEITLLLTLKVIKKIQ